MLPYRLGLLAAVLGIAIFPFLWVSLAYLRDRLGFPPGPIDLAIVAATALVSLLPYLGILWLHRRSDPAPSESRF